MAEWINVKDRLPEFNKKVLITNGDDFTMGWLEHIDIEGALFYCEAPDDNNFYRKTKYWMQPEPPK